MSTVPSRLAASARDERLDAYRTTGPSPGRRSLHLLGVGQVGRALLALLEKDDPLLVAATDTSGTVHDPAGLDLVELAGWKAAGRPLVRHRLALPASSAREAVRRVDADVVVDATATRFDRPQWAGFLDDVVVGRGRTLALAAKDAPARRAHRWVPSAGDVRVGINATLGGAGAALGEDIAELRSSCACVALAGSGSTTVILRVMEAGGSFADGVAEANRHGLLEADPELDFRGADAAVKLAVVAQALWGRAVHPGDIPSEDIRALDPAVVRARALSGRTTRLVARGQADGSLFVGYEELAPGDALAVPADRAVYAYEMDDGQVRLHLGAGMGPEETARALLADVRRLGDQPGRGGARRSARMDAGPRTGVAHLPAGFRLDSGARLHPAQVAFEVLGPEHAPAVVVLGGISADRHVADTPGRPGWWSRQVGPGRAVDPERFRVISIDWLGGAGGSTGPATSTHWPQGASVSTADQARAVSAVLDALGVERAHAVIGASYGGMVGLRLAADAPERVGRVCALAAAHECHPLGTAVRGLQRSLVSRNGGAARTAGQEAFVCLSRSLDRHRLEPERIEVPCTVVAFDSDTLVPQWTIRALADRLRGPARYVEVDTCAGHEAYLEEVEAVAEILRDVLAEP